MARTKNSDGFSLVLEFFQVLSSIGSDRPYTRAEIYSRLADRGLLIHDRKLQRILKTIAENPDVFRVKCQSSSNAYTYRRDPKALALTASPTAEQAFILQLCRNFLNNHIPAELSDSLSRLFETAPEGDLQGISAKNRRRWADKVAVVPGTIPMLPPSVKKGVMETVSKALFEEKILRLTYETADGTVKEPFHAVPLGLVQQDCRLYLVCQYLNYDEIRHFALHRILSAEIVPLHADGPEGFSLDAYLLKKHFNFGRGGRVRLTASFKGRKLWKMLSETPFSRTQELSVLPDGTYRFSAVLDDSVLIDGWLASWAKEAEFTNIERSPVSEEEPA